MFACAGATVGLIVFVWKMAGQTERVMTTDVLSVFQTD